MLNNAAESRDTFAHTPPVSDCVAAVDLIASSWRDELASLPLADLPITDLDAARAIVSHARSDSSWVSFRRTARDDGDWYVWNGKVHALATELVDDLLATRFADDLKAAVLAHKPHERSGDAAKAWEKVAARVLQGMRSAGGLNAIKARVRSELHVASDHFDRDKSIIVMADGRVLSLDPDNHMVFAPDPRRAVTRHLGVTLKYSEDGALIAPVGRWRAWLDRFLPDKEEQD
jgi:hypothetical protein